MIFVIQQILSKCSKLCVFLANVFFICISLHAHLRMRICVFAVKKVYWPKLALFRPKLVSQVFTSRISQRPLNRTNSKLDKKGSKIHFFSPFGKIYTYMMQYFENNTISDFPLLELPLSHTVPLTGHFISRDKMVGHQKNYDFQNSWPISSNLTKNHQECITGTCSWLKGTRPRRVGGAFSDRVVIRRNWSKFRQISMHSTENSENDVFSLWFRQ